MKYSMVKQFSNAAIDNAFGFIFKIVDFGKVMVEVFWAFFDIWAAFFLIFYNIFMYIYYLFLFAIDRGSESGGPSTIRARRTVQKRSKIPKVRRSYGPNPVPSMYRVTQKAETVTETVSSAASATVSAASDTAQKAMNSVKPSPKGSGSKKNYIKAVFEFLSDLLKAMKDIITKPFRAMGEFFSGRLKPVKESESSFKNSSENKSLIDQYMKEYQKNRKK